ncbi:hypothetical protein MTX26_24475 [Bradyrhizobium sp. ISRA443]|uniref:hypothetical protein n=1 Tax=unclassified Bradyrhizobium TaxID=2631580 RepID=UPI002478E140|nr:MULTISPECIES: hypothetical protein [unclassified Bradyrhizobium]WGR93050.1 hypothetical protein MTX20_35395 [Bradyrhizobium sp. ISRA435]WGR97550.1 hypothetical protein MTX23_24470 [Bradyrhizobium sp. ISRA436]WGS04440.1 hypothetical protein MTX18_24475 [Bradyrhizobium sp. ISRA437]WGS11321.1 hypothetical protein MTX26_24475 [Bradyrhizobium sp. ISRA443]
MFCVLALLVGGCAGIVENASSPDRSEDAAVAPVVVEKATRDLTLSERATLADAFSAGLNDPESVKFKWTKIPVVADRERRSVDYCGQLSAKNENGAYRSMEPFLATIIVENGAVVGGAIAALSTANGNSTRQIVLGLCQMKGLVP